MTDYSKGKIYKLTNNVNDEAYIGSTTQPLPWRFTQHKSKYTTGSKTCAKSTIFFDKYGLENCKIELIKIFPCNSKEELLVEERKYIESHPNCMNVRSKPILTYDEKKEYQRVHKRKGYAKHKDKYNAKKICETCKTQIAIKSWNRHCLTPKHLMNL